MAGGLNLAPCATVRDNLAMVSGATIVNIRADLRGIFTAHRRFVRWFERLELYRSGLGARASTSHVTEGEWMEHWNRGMDPASALFYELRRVDC